MSSRRNHTQRPIIAECVARSVHEAVARDTNHRRITLVEGAAKIK